MQQLHDAEEILVTGNSMLANQRLLPLIEQLERQRATHVVGPGESLSVIAARPEVYANGRLWPLIWHENIETVPNPDRVRRGQVLKLRSHPTIEEVVEAVTVARQEAASRERVTPKIGTIRELPASR